MIELQTSNENALALYSLLSEGQRNGTLLSEIRRRGLLVYMNNQCIWSSLYFENSLDKSIMDSVRISHHPNWNGICWNSIKDEKCYMTMM